MPQPQPDQSGSQVSKTANDKNNVRADSDPVEMLKADHRLVEKLFADFEKAGGQKQKSEITRQICRELIVHSMLEEEIFYPACQGHMEQRLLDEAQVEHDGAKVLIVEIHEGSPDDQYFDAKVKVLSEDMKHHIREEEKPRDGILAKAKESGVATAELAKQLAARKKELMEDAEAEALGPPTTRSFRVRSNPWRVSTAREHKMRHSSMTMDRERDDRGRFVSDDDDDRDYPRRSRSYYRDDDDRHMPPRDEEGRFMSNRSRSRYDDDDDYDRRYMRPRDDEGHFTSTRSRSRYDDDDDYRRGRGRGGWYGDSEGHSQASREGWRRSDHEGSGWYGDPRGHSQASREGWRRSDHEGSGWYGDQRGHSQASREGWRHSDHEGSGWYGDPEGHSRASREGWEDRDRGGYRSRSYDDDRRHMRNRDDEGRFTSTRSHSRYDDDDDRRGGRGHGGWYGDPEGHAEAARHRRR